MPEPSECAELAEALAEVATGSATGPVRAQVLAHVMTCENCRDELDELSRVADSVLMIAPEHEPPAGFESAVLGRIAAELAAPPTSGQLATSGQLSMALPPSVRREQPGGHAGRGDDSAGAGQDASVIPIPSRRRWVRPTMAAAAAVVVGLVGAGIVWQATESDRELAAAYNRTLDVANGQYFAAAPLLDSGGEQVGHAFLYQGDPSWVFAVHDENSQPADYEVVVSTPEGDVTIATCSGDDGDCGAGGTVDARVSDISQVRLVSPDGRTAATATVRGSWRGWGR